MKKSKIAFLSVVFPAIEMFLHDFFSSIEKQTMRDFDLYLVNDGLNNLGNYLEYYKNLNVTQLELSGSPAKLREKAIRHLKEAKYEAIIFGDADDFFLENRVEVLASLLKKHNIVANDIDIVDQTGEVVEKAYFSNRLKNGQRIDLNFIKNKNVFGLTNSAIGGDIISDINFDDNLLAVDWYFFSKLLCEKCKASFTSETKSFYRVYGENIAGLGKMDEEKIMQGLRVKTLHYKNLAATNDGYQRLYKQFNKLQREITRDSSLKEVYVKKIKTTNVFAPFWWEEIKPMKIERVG